MKASIRTIAVLSASLAVLLAAGVSSASTITGSSHEGENERFIFHNALGNGIGGDFLTSKEVEEIRSTAIAVHSSNHSSISEAPVAIQTIALQDVLSQVSAAIAKFQDGNAHAFAAPLLTPNAGTILNLQMLHVAVRFDPSEAGGILNVVVDVRPAFSGIGVTNHPLISQATTESIESMTPEAVAGIISKLVKMLPAGGGSATLEAVRVDAQ
jgi:hypothetical protein